jgi:WD40 repeat protein
MRTLLVLTGLAVAAAPLLAADPSGRPLPPGSVRRFGEDRFRIAGAPLASALAPDGTRLAVLSFVRARGEVLLSVFDAGTGRPLCRGSLASEDAFPDARLAFSPNGKYVAAAVAADVRVVWDSRTGEPVTKLPPPTFGPGLCQFIPGGLLAVTDRDRTDLYEIPSGKVSGTWPVGRIARLSADAKTFVRVEPESGAVSLGDPADSTVAGTLDVKTADTSNEKGLALSADGKFLAVVHDRKWLQIWDTARRKLLRQKELSIHPHDPHYAVSFSPDGRVVLLERHYHPLERLDSRSLTALPELQVPWADYATKACGLHLSEGGRTILAVMSHGLVLRWDGETARRLPDGIANVRLCFAVVPDGSELVVGDLTGQIDVWNVATGRVARRLPDAPDSRGSLVCLAISPDGRLVAAGEGHCDIRVLRIDDGEVARRITCPFRLDGGWMKGLAWAPDGGSLFADGSGMIVCRVNLTDGKTAWDVNDENMPWFAPTPDGRYVVTALWDGVQFLDASTGAESRTVRVAMTHEQGPVGPLAWSPDGNHLALGIGGGIVVVCDRTGQELRRFAAAERRRRPAGSASADDPYRVEALAFSPDGKWLVSGAGDLSVRVWEAASGKQVVRFDGHDGAVRQVAVAADGRSAFSAGDDGFVYQWSLTPGPYPGRGNQPDDLWAAAASFDPASAVPAAWALVTGSEESGAFIAKKLPPFAAAKPEEVARWLADLDAAEFAEREAATKALAAQGPLVEPELRETVKATASAEVRRRAEGLLARLGTRYTGDELRTLRLVQSCELSGTATSRALLQRWAGGARGAVLTEDARAALARLDRRPR